MTKIRERALESDGKLIVQETHDFNPVIKSASDLRSAGIDGFGESKLVARVPLKLVAEWAKEAGIKMDDPAMSDVMAKKLNDRDNSQFRVWEGRY